MVDMPNQTKSKNPPELMGKLYERKIFVKFPCTKDQYLY